MADGGLPRRVVELKAGGPDDPDGSRAAVLLGAYFEAEHAIAFRRLLWRRLAIAAAAWGLVATVFLSEDVLIAGLLVIVAAAGYAAVLEWRTTSRLNALIDGRTLSGATVRGSRRSPSPR